MANNKTDLCQQFEQAVWTYLDDDLSTPERSDWKNHLKACAPCQQTLSQALTTEQTYRSLPAYSVSESLIQTLVSQAPSPLGLRNQWSKWQKHLTVRRLGSSLVGAALVVGGIYVFNRYRRTGKLAS